METTERLQTRKYYIDGLKKRISFEREQADTIIRRFGEKGWLTSEQTLDADFMPDTQLSLIAPAPLNRHINVTWRPDGPEIFCFFHKEICEYPKSRYGLLTRLDELAVLMTAGSTKEDE